MIKFLFLYCLVFIFYLDDHLYSNTHKDIIDTLEYGTSEQRISFISRIHLSKNTNDINFIINHYKNEKNASVKLEILKVFSKFEYDEVKIIIPYALKDNDKNILKEAYLLVSLYPDKEFENILFEKLKEEKGYNRDSIIMALSDIKSDIASEYLSLIYYSDDISSNTKIEILRYFSKNGSSYGEDIVIKEISNNEELFIQYMAIIALGAYPSEENYEILKNLLKEDKPEIVSRVIHILPNFKDYDNDIKTIILDSAKHDDESIRKYAIEALKDYRYDNDVENLLLYRMKYDNSEAITLSVLEVYSNGGGEEIIKAIKDLGESSFNKDIKVKARQILDKNGIEYKK